MLKEVGIAAIHALLFRNRMPRTQVQFTKAQAAILRDISRGRQVLMAELMRASIHSFAERVACALEDAPAARAKPAIYKLSLDVGNANSEHERYLAEAFQP